MLSSWSSTTRIRFFLRSIVLAEESLHFGDDRSRLARFGEVSVAAHFHRLLTVRRQCVRRECDDRNHPRRWIVLQDLCRFPSVDDRDGDVHQDQVGLFRPRLGDTLLSVQSFGYFVTEVLQDGGVDYTIVLIVLDQ